MTALSMTRLSHMGISALVLLAMAGAPPARGEVIDVAPPGSPAYAAWENGPSSDPSSFPIAVWLQSPALAEKYKAAGINLYVGLWDGPTPEQLSQLKKAGMPVICAQNELALGYADNDIIVGWMHGDEPDNAQPVKDPNTGEQTWGPPVPPKRIVEDYRAIKAADPTRPVFLNLGQGVANDQWVGRGPGAKLSDYETYVQGCDIVSYDVYPVAGLDRPDGADQLWLVAKGVDRLATWTDANKPIWNCIETTRINGTVRPTPAQVKAEVWMALIHGSRGLIYFVHEWNPRFNEHALLDDPEMLAVVTQINHQVTDLAPVLNAGEPVAGATVASSSKDVPIDALVRRSDGAVYVFAVGMRAGESVDATFTLPDLPAHAEAEVLGEDRTIAVENGAFRDRFEPFAVHLYRITHD